MFLHSLGQKLPFKDGRIRLYVPDKSSGMERSTLTSPSEIIKWPYNNAQERMPRIAYRRRITWPYQICINSHHLSLGFPT
jgi:hypothetical protein